MDKLNNIFLSLIYSTGATIAIYLSAVELTRFENLTLFLIYSFSFILIILLENFLAFIQRNRKIEINLDIKDEVNELSHFFYKIILPITLFFSLVFFLYFNFYIGTIDLILIFSFIIFFLLFLNTKAFFDNLKDLESRTHYIYDILKFFIFFLIVNILSNFQNYNNLNLIISTLGILIISFIITILMIWRLNKIRIRSYIYSFIFAFFSSLIFLILNLTNQFSALQISIGLVFVFYLSIAIIQHILLNTLTKYVLLEYILILLVSIVVIYGIN